MPMDPLSPGERKLIAHWLAQPLTITPASPDFDEIVEGLSSLRRRLAEEDPHGQS